MKRPRSVATVPRPIQRQLGLQSSSFSKGETFESQVFNNVSLPGLHRSGRKSVAVPGGTNPTARMADHGLRDNQSLQMAAFLSSTYCLV